MSYYKIPQLYKGETIFILGGGPSLPELIKNLPLWKLRAIGVNNAFRFQFVDVLWFADSRFYWWYKDDIDKFNGLKITYNRHPGALGSVKFQPNINVVNGRPRKGIHKEKIMFRILYSLNQLLF